MIRTVGEPVDRFQEDYLRILRALRFVIKLGFDIEFKTYIAMKMMVSHLEKTTPDRIRQEVNKMLLCSSKYTFDELNAIGAWGVFTHHNLYFKLTNEKAKGEKDDET